MIPGHSFRQAMWERQTENRLLPFGNSETVKACASGRNGYRLLKNFLSGWSKRFQLRGARKIDERRRTYVVRWSEAIERNEANEPFSTAWGNFDTGRLHRIVCDSLFKYRH
jgi:hypothetical protein